MDKLKSIVIACFFCCTSWHSPAQKVPADTVSTHAWRILTELNAALLRYVQQDPKSPDFGAIGCPHCHLYHTRAAEAVYPFAFEFQKTKDKTYLNAAVNLGNWLVRQQQDDGSWLETPEKWTGTTTDQTLMLALAYPVLRPYLNPEAKHKWLGAIEKAADYLERVMSPGFASINYCATTTATLMFADLLIHKQAYRDKAGELAHHVIAKMDHDYFLTGEGGRVSGVKYGVDLGYNMEMSLWGLALYARLANDSAVLSCVGKSLASHLPFIYPDGSMDDSWGIRSNKWTCFGSGTSDGCTLLFSLFLDKNDQYRTAAIRNMDYLQSCMKDGIVGFGPLYFDIFGELPCIYPTFAKAKNMAMAMAFVTADAGILPPLPSDQNGMKFYPTLNLVTVRSEQWRSTISAYNYKDPAGERSKYMYRPTGGSMCNLWLAGHGFFEASSQTIYKRWEPMSFPEMPDVKPLTPRIEFTDSSGYFTNLYEFDAVLTSSEKDGVFRVASVGELKNNSQQPGGISYRLSHEIGGNYITKEVELVYHDAKGPVRIVEPIIFYPGMTFRKTGDRTVLIKTSQKVIELTVDTGNATLELGTGARQYRFPYPALRAYPIVLNVKNDRGYRETVRFTYRIIR